MNTQHTTAVWKFKVTINGMEHTIYHNDFAKAIYRSIKVLDKTPDIKMNVPLIIIIEKLERRK